MRSFADAAADEEVELEDNDHLMPAEILELAALLEAAGSPSNPDSAGDPQQHDSSTPSQVQGNEMHTDSGSGGAVETHASVSPKTTTAVQVPPPLLTTRTGKFHISLALTQSPNHRASGITSARAHVNFSRCHSCLPLSPCPTASAHSLQASSDLTSQDDRQDDDDMSETDKYDDLPHGGMSVGLHAVTILHWPFTFFSQT